MANFYRGVFLTLLLLVYIFNQWDRYILNYASSVATPECPASKEGDVCFIAKGHKKIEYCDACPGNTTADFWPSCQQCHDCLADHKAPFRNLRDGACISTEQYGILAGFGFSALYVILGLGAGRLADTVNRRNIIVVAFLVWSAAVASQGLAKNFGGMLASRVVLGVGEAFAAPPSYSLIADYFPPESRATANGIYGFGVYVGGGLGSMSVLMSDGIGWRTSCFVVGIAGAVIAVAFLLIVREPSRGGMDAGDKSDAELDAEADKQLPPPERETLTLSQSFASIARTPIVLLVFLGAGLRFFGGYAIGAYLPLYYQRAFPEYNKQYSVLNAFVVSLGGAASSYAGGYLADRLSTTHPRARALIPAFGAALGFIPFIGVLFLPNFYASIACLFFEYLLAESWFGPAISVMQNQLPSAARGVAISVYLFVATMVGNLSPLLIGIVDPGTVAVRVPLFFAVLVSYAGTFVCFVVVAGFMKVETKTEAKPLLDAVDSSE